jgi:hypothetical protein
VLSLEAQHTSFLKKPFREFEKGAKMGPRKCFERASSQWRRNGSTTVDFADYGRFAGYEGPKAREELKAREDGR